MLEREPMLRCFLISRISIASTKGSFYRSFFCYLADVIESNRRTFISIPNVKSRIYFIMDRLDALDCVKSRLLAVQIAGPRLLKISIFNSKFVLSSKISLRIIVTLEFTLTLCLMALNSFLFSTHRS